MCVRCDKDSERLGLQPCLRLLPFEVVALTFRARLHLWKLYSYAQEPCRAVCDSNGHVSGLIKPETMRSVRNARLTQSSLCTGLTSSTLLFVSLPAQVLLAPSS